MRHFGSHVLPQRWWYGTFSGQQKLVKTFNRPSASIPHIHSALPWLSSGHFPLAALLKLKTDIGICAINSPEVFPVCLPERGLVLPDWTECEISGYGKNSECKPKSQLNSWHLLILHGCCCILCISQVGDTNSTDQQRAVWDSKY